MSDAFQHLLHLLGWSLAQALAPGGDGLLPADADLTPLATIEVAGQQHQIAFPELSEQEALQSVRAALAMHGRDIDLFAVVEPTAANHAARVIAANHSLRMHIVAEIQLGDGRGGPDFRRFALTVNGIAVDADDFAHLIRFIDAGYQQVPWATTAGPRPHLPAQNSVL